MSGNKGAVGIQLGYHETSFCLVTAHPASGPGNAEERNTEYCTIVNGLHFFRGKTVESPESRPWFVDTNSSPQFHGSAITG
jgi:hypothetical protein